MTNWTIVSLLPSWVDVGWSIALLSALAYFLRDRLIALVDTKIKHRYDAKLEELKDRLSRSSKEIDTLRSTVLTMRSQRQAAVDKRKLEAIDQLWAAVKALQSRKGQAMTMSLIKFDYAAARTKEDERAREVFEMIGGGKIQDDVFPKHQAHEAQPYVSPLAWALFNAYSSAIAFLFMQMAVVKSGVGPDVMKGPEDMIALLSQAVPEMKEQLKLHGTGVFPHAIDRLEALFLEELRRMIAGEEDDANQLASAARISASIADINRKEAEEKAKAALTS